MKIPPPLTVRMAASDADIASAQRLRYQVFVAEGGGGGTGVDHTLHRETDHFDAFADHLLLEDLTRPDGDRIVGAYRLMTSEQAQAAGGFYSAQEYQLGFLPGLVAPALELSRSCLHRDYRTGVGLMLLWQGLAAHIAASGVGTIFGVASFAGTRPEDHAAALSYLYYYHRAQPVPVMTATAPGAAEMTLIPRAALNRKTALAALPPLIKSYLRLGAVVSDTAYVDRDFNTVDIGLVVDVGAIPEPEMKRFFQGRRAMNPTWDPKVEAPHLTVTPMGYVRAALRATPLIGLIASGLIVLLALRLIERPLFGQGRPVTPFITQFVCRNGLRILGFGYQVQGAPMRGPGAVVANHSSWLDIFALNATKRIYFVSKAEVADWPGIGWLARATGTVFIKRERREAASQIDIFRQRLAAGHKLLFFPEGTSSDGRQILPFKPTLFAAFFDPALRDTLSLQAVTLSYLAPQGEDVRFYGWWGQMALAPHLLATLAARRQGTIRVRYADPVRLTDFSDRKVLAREMEKQVRAGLTLHDGPEV